MQIQGKRKVDSFEKFFLVMLKKKKIFGKAVRKEEEMREKDR